MNEPTQARCPRGVRFVIERNAPDRRAESAITCKRFEGAFIPSAKQHSTNGDSQHAPPGLGNENGRRIAPPAVGVAAPGHVDRAGKTSQKTI